MAIDYISGTEDAYVREDKMITVQVSGPVESEKSFGFLVDLIFDVNGRNTSASRLEWFPKSICTAYRVEPIDDTKETPNFFLKAPEWILKNKKVKY